MLAVEAFHRSLCVEDIVVSRHFFAACCVVVLGCGGTTKVARSKPPLPPTGATAAVPAKDNHLSDVKAAVAGQLECSVEQTNVTCVRRDSQGECIAVRGDGCERSVEYQFGDG